MKKKDKKIISVILILVLTSFLLWFLPGISSGGYQPGELSVRVSIDKSEYGIYPLDEELTLELGSNQILIRDNTVTMAEASCPDQSCIRQGTISRPGEAIVCLPNRIACEIIANSSGEFLSRTTLCIGTVITIKAYTENSSIMDECFDMIDSYEQIFSTTLPDSELYKLNHRLLPKDSLGYSSISPELYRAISLGLSMHELSGGHFNICIGAITGLWNFTDTNSGYIPEDKLLQELIRHTDPSVIKLKEDNGGYFISVEDDLLMIDLGGMAKGYIGDRIREFLVRKGLRRAIINLGGDTLCIGEDITIGIQKPFGSNGELADTITVDNQSVVTSGTYERYFEADGRLYHHIINPFTGWPYDTDIVSATVVGDSTMWGDFYSTYLCSMNMKEAGDFAVKNNLQVVLIDNNGREFKTP